MKKYEICENPDLTEAIRNEDKLEKIIRNKEIDFLIGVNLKTLRYELNLEEKVLKDELWGGFLRRRNAIDNLVVSCTAILKLSLVDTDNNQEIINERSRGKYEGNLYKIEDGQLQIADLKPGTDYSFLIKESIKESLKNKGLY